MRLPTLREVLLINNYLVFQVNKRFRMSTHAGIGRNYVDRKIEMSGHVESYPGAVVPELGFSFGYCF